eukprot:7383182-Prymnesium_polylepis.1
MGGARTAKSATRGRVAHGLGGWWRVILYIKWAPRVPQNPQIFSRRATRSATRLLRCAIAEAS